MIGQTIGAEGRIGYGSVMFRRLFIALLIVCLAVPALAGMGGSMASAATGHCAPAAPVPAAHDQLAGEHDHAPAPNAPMIPAGHLCIGCIAGNPAVAAVAAPLVPPAIVPHRSGQRQLAGLLRGPDTPPPRA